jgi:hypothetical protein
VREKKIKGEMKEKREENRRKRIEKVKGEQ